MLVLKIPDGIVILSINIIYCLWTGSMGTVVRRKFHYTMSEHCHGSKTITSGVEEMPPPNSRRLSYGSITITPGVEEMPHLVWRKCHYQYTG
jgi:hypothetical protein